jgi:hypothetical protein
MPGKVSRRGIKRKFTENAKKKLSLLPVLKELRSVENCTVQW